VKEIGRLGGDITSFVSPRVAVRLATRFEQDAHDATKLIQTLNV
jgi:pantetheine-phosphate adenylyltransferase